jgi:hypothetical protein
MTVVYAILSILGWAWCAVAAVYLLVRLRRQR